MQLPPPILIEGVPHLCYADLLQAVAIELFPANGIQTQTEYEQVVKAATQFAHAQHFYIQRDLHPPTVPATQQGIYLQQVKCDPEKLLSLAKTIGYVNQQKQLYIVGHPTLQHGCKRMHNILNCDLDELLDTFITETMRANGWIKRRSDRDTHEQYEHSLPEPL